jgi:hypothetical protein
MTAALAPALLTGGATLQAGSPPLTAHENSLEVFRKRLGP